MQAWVERQKEIAALAERQLFFLGGAPRSGTTWLQQMLDSHPDVSCRGEGLFQQQLANPMDRLMAERAAALEAKNVRNFRHTGGYPLPSADDSAFLTATAILLALQQQSQGRDCLAIGEKTPENVFFFPRLKLLFPRAKLICIARDPRDVLTSAWHFFHQAAAQEDEAAAKTAFIQGAFASLNEGARTMMALAEAHPADCVIVTYEALRLRPAPILARLFGFLGVTQNEDLLAGCVERTSFAHLTGGRSPGTGQSGAFLRKGIVGDWTGTLSAEMNQLILRELGWMFPYFGWSA